jgi:hypothetical protein
MTTILQEANEIIYGDREKTYGRPDKNLNCIAAMWNAYLQSTGRDYITAHDVCMMMSLLKVARQANAFKRDNLVDACGYLALADRIENEVRESADEK